jgi:hypothetical protein
MTGTTIWRGAAAVALSLGLLACCPAAPDATSSADDLAAWVDRRVEDWKPSREERRFDDIGWARDIRAALALAKEHGRPVFLFTYDGVCLATYRC